MHLHAYPGFVHIWDIMFIWNISDLVIHLPLYMILTSFSFWIIDSAHMSGTG